MTFPLELPFIQVKPVTTPHQLYFSVVIAAPQLFEVHNFQPTSSEGVLFFMVLNPNKTRLTIWWGNTQFWKWEKPEHKSWCFLVRRSFLSEYTECHLVVLELPSQKLKYNIQNKDRLLCNVHNPLVSYLLSSNKKSVKCISIDKSRSFLVPQNK